MTRRRGARAASGSIEGLLNKLPERFWQTTPEVEDGQMTGLHRYLVDLDSWLRSQMGLLDVDSPRSKGAARPPTFAVLDAIGIPPSEWYSTVLNQAHPSHPTAQARCRITR